MVWSSANSDAPPLGEASSTSSVTLLDLLELEQVQRNLYRSVAVFDEPFPLYGGQVAAQALYAAGLTVPADRVPHSLHGYYLRGGATAKPTLFQVHRDREGRSYSARRVVATQEGEVIFTMSASFSVPEPGTDHELDPMPDVPGPDALPESRLDRLQSVRVRFPPWTPAGAELPTRFWARCAVDLPDEPLLHACVLTYLSDASSGLLALADGASTGASLDHAVWFHRSATLDDWVLVDLVPHTVARGRGWYTGTVHSAAGARIASLTQESLFRAARTR